MTRHTDQELDAFADWERRAWESHAAAYAGSLADLTSEPVAALLDAAAVREGVRVLDAGTGPGFVALAAAARGAVVTGVDQSSAMVEIARAAGVDAVVAPVERLPFEDESYDAVVAGFLLNHLARPEAALASLARVLRPGGRIALTVWDRPDANPALGLFGPVAESIGLSAAGPSGPDAHLFAHDEAMLGLLSGALADSSVERAHWSVTVDPGSWFDAVVAAAPRTGAVLAAATDEQRAVLRARYVQVAVEQYGLADGRVELPACAVLGSATKR